MKGTGKRRDVCICGQLCGGDEFHAEVSVSGSDGVVTSAHLELATVSAKYLWATARRPGSDIAKPRMSSYTLRLAERLVDVVGPVHGVQWLTATDTPRPAMCNGGTTR